MRTEFLALLRKTTATSAILGIAATAASYAFATPTTPAQAKVTQAANVSTKTKLPDDGSIRMTPEESEFVDRVNHERTSRGLAALTIDPTLIRVARSHSEEMCRLDYFDHHSPTAGLATPMDRYLKTLGEMGQSSPDYLLVGENIYYCSTLNAHYNVAYGHKALMESPGHRANILEPRYAKIGVGTYRDAKGQFWVTETFLRDTAPDNDNQ